MAAEIIQNKIELYRFKEGGGTYFSSCIIMYRGNSAEIKGLVSPFDLECRREINNHLHAQGLVSMTYNIKGRSVTRRLRKYQG